MIEHIVFRCQLLSVFAECRPCCTDTILDFRRFLVVERDFLTKIFHAFISCQYFDFHVFNFKFLFVSELMKLWLLRIFVLSGRILSPTFSVLFLISHNIFRRGSLDVANSSTSLANLRFVRQSNSRLDSGSPCLVPFRISKMLLSSSVCTDAFWSLKIFFKRLM